MRPCETHVNRGESSPASTSTCPEEPFSNRTSAYWPEPCAVRLNDCMPVGCHCVARACHVEPSKIRIKARHPKPEGICAVRHVKVSVQNSLAGKTNRALTVSHKPALLSKAVLNANAPCHPLGRFDVTLCQSCPTFVTASR